MKRLWLVILGLTLILILPCAASANPIPIIEFQAIDLPDATPGQDLWQYQYTVSYTTPDTFMQYDAFSIFFDLNLFSGLADTSSYSSDWFTFVLQPDLNLPADGEYDAFALVNDPSLANLFSVDFVWLGGPGSAPGSQPFLLSQYDLAGNYLGSFGSGQTSPLGGNPVPEPATLLLVGLGLATLAIARRRKI